MAQQENMAQGKVSRNAMMWVLLFFGYEWFVSGINKLASGEFITGLHNTMMSSIKGGAPYPFYGHFLKSFCMTHCIILGTFIEVGEIFIGAVFILVGIIGLIKGNLAPWLAKLGIAASIVSAFLSINIFLYVGGHYFFGQADPFDEGVTLDFLMFLVQLAMIGYFIAMNRIAKHSHYQAEKRITG